MTESQAHLGSWTEVCSKQAPIKVTTYMYSRVNQELDTMRASMLVEKLAIRISVQDLTSLE